MPGPRPRAMALLVDLDGTLRHWDHEVQAAAERRHGLAPGTILRTAMEWPRVQPAITGQITHAEWMAGVAAALDTPEAVRGWEEYHGEVDADVLGLVKAARQAGLPVGIATNATDRLDADLTALGLAGAVDAVLNSSVLGVPKPSPEYFARACRALRTPPEKVLFVDDSDRFVRGARAAGLSAYRWTGPADLPYLRAALGLD
jgi:putative hydrolase of the HAD superfamily